MIFEWPKKFIYFLFGTTHIFGSTDEIIFLEREWNLSECERLSSSPSRQQQEVTFLCNLTTA